MTTTITPVDILRAADIIRAAADHSRVTWLDEDGEERSGHLHGFSHRDGDISEWTLTVISRMGFVSEMPFLLAVERYAAGALAFRWID